MKKEYNLKILLVEMRRATWKEIAEHINRQAKIIPASCIKACYAPLLIIQHRLWKVPKSVEEWRDRRMVCMWMILVLM